MARRGAEGSAGTVARLCQTPVCQARPVRQWPSGAAGRGPRPIEAGSGSQGRARTGTGRTGGLPYLLAEERPPGGFGRGAFKAGSESWVRVCRGGNAGAVPSAGSGGWALASCERCQAVPAPCRAEPGLGLSAGSGKPRASPLGFRKYQKLRFGLLSPVSSGIVSCLENNCS